MKVIYDTDFDTLESIERSQVFQIFPNVFQDGRGNFAEILKNQKEFPKYDLPLWMTNLQWIQQVNRSESVGKVIRGCHAQSGLYCQAKLVTSVLSTIIDVITDGRPNSKTFGKTKLFVLDPKVKNLLFVPRGFLHAFITLNDDNTSSIFEYFCDNTYNKASEVGVNPLSVLLSYKQSTKNVNTSNLTDFQFFQIFGNTSNFTLSEKDTNSVDFEIWKSQVLAEFKTTGKLWYIG